jgi:hypothetical protein
MTVWFLVLSMCKTKYLTKADTLNAPKSNCCHSRCTVMSIIVVEINAMYEEELTLCASEVAIKLEVATDRNMNT